MIAIFILIFINVVVFFVPYIINFGGRYGDSFVNFISLGWKSNPDIADGEYYRLLTSNFLHGGVTHLLLNMISLYNVGPAVVSAFGTALFLIIYLLSGVSGSLFSFLFNPRVPSLGASGAIMGLVGAFLAFSVYYKLYGNLQVVLINLLLIFALGIMDSRIDNYGHLGGFVCGLVLGFAFLYLRLTPGFSLN